MLRYSWLLIHSHTKKKEREEENEQVTQHYKKKTQEKDGIKDLKDQ